MSCYYRELGTQYKIQSPFLDKVYSLATRVIFLTEEYSPNSFGYFLYVFTENVSLLWHVVAKACVHKDLLWKLLV